MLHDEGIERLIDWLHAIHKASKDEESFAHNCISGLRELQQTRKDLKACMDDQQEWFDDWFKQSKLSVELLTEMADHIDNQSLIRKAKDLVFSFQKLSSIL